MILLCLFCIVYPFYSWAGTWCLIAFSIFWLINKVNYPTENYLQKLHWPFLLYFAWHVFGMLWSSDFQEGINDLQSKSAFLLLPLMIASLDWKKEELLLVLRFFLFGIILTDIIYLGFGGYRFLFLEEPSTVLFYSELTSPFKNHPAFTSSYSIFGIVYLLYLFFEKRERFEKSKNWNIIVILFLWLMVVLYASRMQILVILFIISLMLCWYLIPKKKFFKLLFTVALFYGITFLVTSSLSVTASRLENATSNIAGLQNKKEELQNIRFQLWESALEIGSKNMLLGVGTGDINSSLMENYVLKGFEKAKEKQLNAHNQYLQSFATLGIVGLISYLLLLIIPSLRAIKTKNFIILAFYLIFALGTLTECMLETQRGSVWLAVFGSLFWGRENFLSDKNI